MDEKFYIDAPSCTIEEGTALFYYHIRMAISYFEVMDEDVVCKTGVFDDIHFDAVNSFMDKLQRAYKEAE